MERPADGNLASASVVNSSESEDQYYKRSYRQLKRTLRAGVSKNEFLKSELKMNQKKLQILEEDKYFLMERLLGYEKPPESPEPPSQEQSDSDQDVSSSLASSVTVTKRPKFSVSSVQHHHRHPGGVTFASAFSKVKPQRSVKRVRKQKTINDFLDSPSCFGGLEDEDSSSFAMDGAVDIQTYGPEEDSE